MRLDKFVSQSSGLSRKAVKQALHRQRIAVNGEITKSASRHLEAGDQVTLDGDTLALPSARYWMLNKPAGVICATEDPNQPCVLDLLPPEQRAGLQIVGRLDKDTTGLLLLTDDGQWNHRVSSPRRHCPKVYEVTTADPIPESAIDAFRDGVLLKDEAEPTRPAELQRLDAHRARVTLTEGRYHQVKRMFGAIGNRVTALHRAAIGGIHLDPDLPEGHYRPLTEEERERV